MMKYLHISHMALSYKIPYIIFIKIVANQKHIDIASCAIDLNPYFNNYSISSLLKFIILYQTIYLYKHITKWIQLPD